MSAILKETNFDWLGKKKSGKVRDIYEQENRLILITTDRHSSFDRIIAHIPSKGAVLNLTSAFWFKKTEHIIPNHLIEIPDPNVIVAKKAKPFLVEVVVRGYLTGVTDTSIWTNYQKGKRDFGDIVLPHGMTKNAPLPKAIITPTTKAGHDENLALSEVVPRGLATAAEWAEMQKAALALFKFGQEHAKTKGLILVDTKYEFGLHGPSTALGAGGKVILIDEVHTPDNSRYWHADSYEERVSKGEEPMAFDKEFLRIWFKQNCDPYKDAVLPEAPPEMITEMSRRYVSLYEQLTGETFTRQEEGIEERISKNLEKYRM
jgi:phosphoribosylaminoimidazole-succinocarboxamide synthase